MKTLQKPFGIYIHWPYCLSKCPYCDFASCPAADFDEAALWPGYERDIRALPEERPITSIFFGGGTPSLMSASFCRRMLDLIRARHPVADDCEITMEANPDAIDMDKMVAFREAGVNRLSIGVQSLLTTDLRFLGRRHGRDSALARVAEAVRAFPEVSMDLIYARPHQTLAAWQIELTEALALGLQHYSLYQLTIEEGTAFARRGVQPADEEMAAELYRLTDRLMAAAGIPAYEVSNYAAPGHECRHNLTYWRGEDYGAIGPAAHGRIGLWAVQHPASVAEWLRVGAERVKLTPVEKQEEQLIMGIRLRQEGYPSAGLSREAVADAIRRRWVDERDGRLFPTLSGVLMLNQLTLLLMP